MQLIIQQHIVIHQFKVGSISNSSVLQVGTAGSVRALSNLYNTGGFTEKAPELGLAAGLAAAEAAPLVPLPSPSR